MDFDDFVSYLLMATVALVGFFCLGLGGYSASQAVRASGEMSYCYVEYDNSASIHPPVYILRGFRPWRADRLLGAYATNDQAIDAANKMQCSVKAKP